MNPAQLLAHFERIAEAPDAVPRLRRFILDLAVRGKLVEQDPKDEPATEVLKRIQVRKERLVKEGKIKKQDLQRGIKVNEMPFPLPSAWAWTRLGDVIHLVSGQHLQPGEYSNQKENGPPYITGPADFGKNGLVITRYATIRKAVASEGQILLTVKGAGVGKTALCDLPEVAISRQLMAMTAIEWSQPFLLLTAHRLAAELKESARSLIPGISREDVDQFIFPLPPLAEQHRIVAKVDELMALCDELEAAQVKREKRRDRLVAATLHGLNNGDAVEASARFTFQHLPHLTAHPEHIRQLRQTILNLAVRGRLVAQDANDEPAAKLLKRVESQKEKLIKERQIRRPKQLPPIGADEVPFSVPKGWEWARLGDLCFTVTDGAHHTPHYAGKGVPFLSVKDISSGKIDFSNTRFISHEAHAELCRRCKPEFGNVLLTKVGTTGIAVTINTSQEFSIFVSLALLKFPVSEIAPRFLEHLLNSPFVRKQSADNTQGIGNKNLVLRLISLFQIPLPPLAEQHRIVAKVDELMALCDALEAQLTTTASTSRQLLEATLHEALAL